MTLTYDVSRIVKCRGCNTRFPWSIHQNGQERVWCNQDCRRRRDRTVRRHGLTLELYEDLIESGLCAACQQPAKGRMSIDHDHKSGRVRGWVHQQCNLIIAHLEDRQEKVTKCQEYLDKWKT